jgi:hypothetical protein
MSDTITTIQIQVETRELLKKVGHKGESYDSLVRRLIQENNKVLDRIDI